MTERRIVATSEAPAAIGPYSQAVVAGDLVFCSGQVAFDPKTMEIVPGGVEAETEQVLKNLAAVLEEAGSSLSRAVRMTIFLADMNDFARVNEVYGRFFDDEPPARVTVQAAGLPKNVQVEIDCIALVGQGSR